MRLRWSPPIKWENCAFSKKWGSTYKANYGHGGTWGTTRQDPFTCITKHVLDASSVIQKRTKAIMCSLVSNNSSPIHLQELVPLELKPYYDMVLFLIRFMIDFIMNLINKIHWIHWIWNDKPKCHHIPRTLNNFSHKINLIWTEMEGPNPWEGYKPNN